MAREPEADVLILAAGFGKRLGVLTQEKPKPLMEVAGRTLIDRNLELVAKSGFNRVFINLHYLPEQIKSHVEDGRKWGLEVKYFHESEILDTGGAVKNVEPEMKHSRLVILNSDIVLGDDFCLSNLLECHCKQTPVSQATLVLRPDVNAKKFGVLGIDSDDRIISFLGEKFFELEVARELMFTGVSVIEKSVIAEMPEAGSIFSITKDSYRGLLEQGARLMALPYEGYWNDVGTPERLKQANLDLSS